ncbi:hypothetical protein [Virgibacillus sp. LDC-1]|uniref:hypothetical protein n=1 Tax=Virgibacillus sp. LDC-1 TaxID=3039856 RepID=UPI0024DE9E76|nr:hypothetical protein [Virgibacillus sp. LDC-1]
MMKKLKKLVFNLTSVTIITGFIFLVSATSALAHYYAYGYSLYSMTYNLKTGGDWYFSEAAKNWGNAVGTNISQNGYSGNTARLASYSYTWYGQYAPKVSGGKTYAFDIRVNTRTLARDYGSDSGYASWQSIVSTATHEFGHAQFLNDLESGWGNASIMSYERNRDTIYKPQSHDITDIQNMR